MNYKNKFIQCIASFLILIIVSCASTKDPQTTLPSKIAPNNSRISGTVISIDEVSESSGVCSIKPCVAAIKINNVIGSGFGFKTPLIKGDTIKIKFEYTLSETTKELFPTLNKSFSGLKIGDKFIADVERIELIQLGNNSTKFKYIIYNYDNID